MLKEIGAKEFVGNPIKMLHDEWALLTSGKKDDWNTMTVSWGGVGELWAKDVVFVFVRPQRYTMEFMQKNDLFTLSFFGGRYKKELGVCGAKSGRDIDKARETGFIPYFVDDTTTFKQAELVMVCRKLYTQKLDPDGFLDKTILQESYPKKDYHTMFVGEIIKVLAKDIR